MDSSYYEALVIILSITLAIFLILSIILIIKMIQIANVAKRITEHAEQVADRAEHISEFFDKTTTPAAVVKLVSNVSEVFQKKEKKK